MKPLYVHDCEKCKFIGIVFGKLDIYVCNTKGGTYSSIIARHSSDEPDYTSIPVDVKKESKLIERNIIGLDYNKTILIILFKKIPTLIFNGFKPSGL